MTNATLRAGDQIGDWTVDDVLGAGGMGTVYRVHHTMIPSLAAALKIMNASSHDEAAARFLREVQAILRLNHPNIVRVSGFGRDPERDLMWMTMDLVEGGDLDTRFAEGPMPFEKVIDLFTPLADALAHAHENGVFHRDLKPSNVLFDTRGQARLVDFGIAVQQQESRLTKTGIVVGTPAYLPPELFEGEEGEPALADLYAFGQLMYEAATGIQAFPDDTKLAESQRLVRLMGLKVRAQSLDPGPGFPPPFRALIRSLTEPAPSRRLATAVELKRQLAALAGRPKASPQARPAPTRRRRTSWVAALAVGGVASIVLAAIALVGVAGAGVAIWLAVARMPEPEPALPEAEPPPPPPTLQGEPAFIAAMAEVETAPCASDAGKGEHRASLLVTVEDGRIREVRPATEPSSALFAACATVQLLDREVDLPDGRGRWTFEAILAPDRAWRAPIRRLRPAPTIRSAAAFSLPQSCGLTVADHGPLEPGAFVKVGRHRPVEGDANWTTDMDAFVGRTSKIRKLGGIDEQGCAMVRLEVDDGRWSWRVRDMEVVPSGAASRVSPQACEGAEMSMAPVEIGSVVKVGKHRPVDGEPNWAVEMEAFVGRTARVQEHIGSDSQGCPVVRIDVDEEKWAWRVRDLTLL